MLIVVFHIIVLVMASKHRTVLKADGRLRLAVDGLAPQNELGAVALLSRIEAQIIKTPEFKTSLGT